MTAVKKTGKALVLGLATVGVWAILDLTVGKYLGFHTTSYADVFGAATTGALIVLVAEQ